MLQKSVHSIGASQPLSLETKRPLKHPQKSELVRLVPPHGPSGDVRHRQRRGEGPRPGLPLDPKRRRAGALGGHELPLGGKK